jgi:hypothetical protein
MFAANAALDAFARAKTQRGVVQDWPEQDWPEEDGSEAAEGVSTWRQPEAIKAWKNFDLYNALHLPRNFSGGSTRVRASYHKMAMVRSSFAYH